MRSVREIQLSGLPAVENRSLVLDGGIKKKDYNMSYEPKFWDTYEKLAFWKGFSLGVFLGFATTLVAIMLLGAYLGV